MKNDELQNMNIVYLDIETKVKHKKPSTDDTPKFIGFRTADGRKVMYHANRKRKIQAVFDYYDIIVGHNIKNYDIPIMENHGYKLGKTILIDTYDIMQKRAKTMLYLDLSMADLSLKSLAIRFNLESQKGDIDYDIFKRSVWTFSELEDIKKYLYGDLDTGWALFEYLHDFFYGFKHYMKPYDQRTMKWLTSSSGSNAYKIICNMANMKEEYTSDDEKLLDPDEVKYQGAYVALPYVDKKQGNIYCVDFSSLYPMMFMGGNLYSRNKSLTVDDSFDTSKYWNGGKIYKSILDDPEDGIKGIYSTTRGKIESTIHELYTDRVGYKSKMKSCNQSTVEYKKLDSLQLATKITINTLYGISGCETFKSVYDLTTAADCTAMSRQSIKHARKRLTEEGYECMYTDSVLGRNHFYFFYKNRWISKDFIEFEKMVLKEIKHTVSIKDGKIRYFLEEPVLTYSMTKDKKIVTRPIKYLMSHTTRKPCYFMEFNSGRVLGVTQDHSLMDIIDGELGEVSPLDATRGMIFRKTNDLPKKCDGIEDSIFVLLGLYSMLGMRSENFLPSSKGIVFTRIKTQSAIPVDVILELVLRPITRHYNDSLRIDKTESYYLVIKSKSIKDIIIKFFGDTHKPYTIPDWVYELRHDQIVSFLRGAFMGLLPKKQLQRNYILKTQRDWQISDVFSLLNHIGIFPDKRIVGKVKHHHIVFQQHYMKWIKENLVPLYYGNKLIVPPSSMKQRRDYYMEHIVENKMLPLAVRKVYDIEVEETHNFFANDVLVHNTDSVYINDPYDDEERVHRVCMQISDEQRADMNIPVAEHNLEVETKIDQMYFFKNDKGEYVKKFYAYVCDDNGEKKVKLKGIKLVKGDVSALAKKVYEKYITQDLLDFKDAYYDPELVFEWVETEFADDPLQLSKRFRVNEPTSYKISKGKTEPTSIQYTVSKRYGAGEHWLIPNTEGLGVGKTKSYAKLEELQDAFSDDWYKHVLLTPIVEELKVFIQPPERKRIKKLQEK